MSSNPNDHSHGLPQWHLPGQPVHQVPAQYLTDPAAWQVAQHQQQQFPGDPNMAGAPQWPATGQQPLVLAWQQPTPPPPPPPVDPARPPVAYGDLHGAPAAHPHPAAPADVTYRARVEEAAVTTTVIEPPRDPQRTALAAVITFVVAIIGLWSILAYMNSMADTLSTVDATNRKIIGQLETANAGMATLEQKTRQVEKMNAGAEQLKQLMGGIDADMGTMLDSVATVDKHMGSMNSSLGDLNGHITAVSQVNNEIAGKLGGINSGLGDQARMVRGMRRDIVASSAALGHMPQALRTTNARLRHVNGIVCLMGTNGITNKMHIVIRFFGIQTGMADISATMIPPGGWRC